MNQRRVFEVLERAEAGDRLSRNVDIFIVSLVIANVTAAIIETLPAFEDGLPPALWAFEVISMVIFTIEYLLRVWSCTASRQWSGFTGRVRFALTPLMLIDLFVLVMTFGIDMRPLRILRLVRLGRYSKRLRLLGEVIRDRREELAVSIGVALMLLIATSTAMYYVELDANDDLNSIPKTMWWGVATLTTVGYGDVTPVTAAGKFLGGIVALIGVGMFALPAGILAGGFAEGLERLRNEGRKNENGDTSAKKCPHCGEAIEGSGS